MAFLTRLKRGFGNFFSFFGESWNELKKVRWPTRKELVSYTIVVIVTVLLITIYFWGLDIGISFLVELVI